jgi:hypothetical protein
MPVQWVYVWQGLEGPTVGGPFPTMEAAMDALAAEWMSYNDGGVEDNPRELFEEEYAESPDLWVTTLATP